MHPCLAIPELLIRICSECDASSLARLGYTARLFDCALDILWSGWHTHDRRQCQIPLTALLECFPHEALNSSSLELQNWERFNFYAERVKAFSLDTSRIHPAFRSVLRSRTFPRGILPNLTTLSIWSRHEDELVYAHPFLSSQLEGLSFCLSTDQPLGVTVTSFLLSISAICTNATRFGLRISGIAFNNAVPTLLENLRHLRRLSLSEISTDHLPLIANLRNLTHLTLFGTANSNVALPSVPTALFEGLTDLKLTLSLEHFLALFSLLSKCPLESLELHVPDLRSASEFAGFVRAIVDKCQTQSLLRVSIDQYYSATDDPAVVPADLLEPFLRFPNITRFHCFLCCRILLNDSFISSLATSWPQLSYLHLYDLPSKVYDPGNSHPTRATASSLAWLATHCPRLRSITLNFDATSNLVLPRDAGADLDKVDLGVSFPTPATCNTSVHTLDVRYSKIGEPNAVATYLRSLFPNITSMSFSTPEGMERRLREAHEKRWASVVDVVRQKRRGLRSV